MNFHEKAHFVKGRRGGLGVAERYGFPCPSRDASIRTLGEPLFGGSVHYGIRLFGLPIEGAAIFASILKVHVVVPAVVVQVPAAWAGLAP